MSKHALFSPSSAHRWIPCPGSFAYPGNTEDSESSTFADDGTYSHTLAAQCLRGEEDASYFIDCHETINGVEYRVDEARAELVQTYLDFVRERSIGRELFIEHRIDLSGWLGDEQGGTLDCGIGGGAQSDEVDIIDLKGGSGHKVFASYQVDGKRYPNHQLGLYAAGFALDMELLGHTIRRVNLIVVQPKLHHIDIQQFSMAEIRELMGRAQKSSLLAEKALTLTPEQATDLMAPSDATCLWCRAKAQCPKLAAYVAEQVDADFETILVDEPEVPAFRVDDLSRAFGAVPLIEQWCYSVRQKVSEMVADGFEVLGTDGLPLKFVEGKMSGRKWIDEEAATAALVGQLGPKAYKPQEPITAPAAAKLLDKKATKQLWTDIFEPMIHKLPGKPQLALGSDERPAYTGTATDDDFEEITSEAE